MSLRWSCTTCTPLGHDPGIAPATLQLGTGMVPRYLLFLVSMTVIPWLTRSAKYIVLVAKSNENMSVLACVAPLVVQSCKQFGVTVWLFFFSSRRRHTRSLRDWSSDVCSSD